MFASPFSIEITVLGQDVHWCFENIVQRGVGYFVLSQRRAVSRLKVMETSGRLTSGYRLEKLM